MRLSTQVRTAAIAAVVSVAGSVTVLTGVSTDTTAAPAAAAPAAAAQPGAVQAAQRRPDKEWVGSWATAMVRPEAAGLSHDGFTNQSVRYLVRPSVGGDKLRIRLSNVFGEKAVQVGSATVAKPDLGTPDLKDVVASTKRVLTFNGATTATMNKGAELLSDPVDLRLADVDQLAVSLYFPTATGQLTWHAASAQSSFYGPADLVNDTSGGGYVQTRGCCWNFLSGVDVQTKRSEGSVVILGDSIADGTASTPNANNRWPDQLAERLAADRRDDPGILNLGITGNRLTRDGTDPILGGAGFEQLGLNALARLNEDVFAQTGVRTVITHLGVNDLWMTGQSAPEMIAVLRQINAQAKQHGLRSLVSTIMPYEGYTVPGGWTPEKEASRQQVNTFLRTSREFDGLIDFDKIMRDPAAPTRLLPAWDSGDHIHPNDAGYQAMAAAVPLHLIR